MSSENIKTILLVEDEAIIAIVVSRALQRFGYNVLNASSGERSVELTFSDEKIDLILMDINLGDGIDGTEAARRILAKKNIPIVFHTSHSEREMVEKVRNITRYGYVVKSSGDFVLQSSMEMAFDLFNSHEEARKESLRSHTILRTIPDMMFVVDGEGFFKDFSGNADSDTLAIPPEKIIGSNINVLFPPDEVQKLLDLFRKCLETGDVQSYIYTMDIVNEQHVYDLRIAKLDEEEVLAIVRDITDRKRAEVEIKNKTEELEAANEELNAAIEEMEASNEELIAVNEDLQAKDRALLSEKIFIEALLESIPGYLYVYDENGSLIRWNKKHEAMTGYSAEELSHMNMSDWFEGEDAVRVAAAVDEVFRTGYGEVEANLLIKGGGKLLIRSNGVKLTLDGKTYFTGVGIDISQQKKTESALREAEELYKKAQKMGHVGNWEYNLQTTNFWGSDEAKRIYGFDPEQTDFSTDEVEKCIPERERVHQALIDLIESDKEYNLEFEIHPKDGSSPRIIWSIAELQRDESGNPLMVTGVIHDITGRKQDEEKIKSLLREKEILLTETHHRVKNNMNTIYGLLSLQSDELKDEECKAVLNDSALRIKRMMILYDKLYRSDNYNEMSIKGFLEPLISEVLGLFSCRASIKAEVNIEDFMLNSKVLSPVGIILNEFITNSIKYAFNDKESGIISISVERKENAVTMIYQDNGAGLPDSVTFENPAGFGMKLADMLAEQIGGTIRIDRGEGTRFVLEFEAV